MAFQYEDFVETPPDWTAEGAEPTEEIKKSGFVAGYKPPALYFNWFWTKVSKLLAELVNKVKKIQSYLSANNFRHVYNVGKVADLNRINTLYHQTKAYSDSYIILFIPTGDLFSRFGVTGFQGEINSESNTITFSECGVVLKYDSMTSSWQRVMLPTDNIPWASISNDMIMPNTISDDRLAEQHMTFTEIINYSVNSWNIVTNLYKQYVNASNNHHLIYFTPEGTLAHEVGAVYSKIDVHFGMVYFGEKTYRYNAITDSWQKVYWKVQNEDITDLSISANKLDFVPLESVRNKIFYTMSDIQTAYEEYDDDYSDRIIYFYVGAGSLRSIALNATAGILDCRGEKVTFNNGEVFIRGENGGFLPTRLNTSCIADGAITRDKLSDDLKALLGI